MLEYADVSSSGLRLSCLAGPYDISPLHPISRRSSQITLEDRCYTVEVGILGASHFLSIYEAGAQLFTEVFACNEIAGDCSAQRLFFGPLGGNGTLGPIDLTMGDGRIHYQFRAWTIQWSDVAEQAVAEMQGMVADANGNEVGLLFEFPAADGVTNTAQRPLTLVLLGQNRASEQTGLQLKTVHSYPNECAVVFTQSNITLSKGELS